MTDINDALTHRFGEPPLAVAEEFRDLKLWQQFATRRSVRRFRPEPVDLALIETLSALALAAPTKSDLQQRDIVIISDDDLRHELNTLLADQQWIAKAPSFLVFCGNNQRQRLLHEWCDRDFANDHLDAFFNAAIDAGIALATFVLAAEAAGLGCCPVSAIRNRASEVSKLLDLPDFVFPIAGLALGWPSDHGEMSLRLQLDVTVHKNRYTDAGLREKIEAYDRRRSEVQPYGKQRHEADYGVTADYGWSEDKARQYSKPERADFGTYVRSKGFDLK
ncbi:MAG: nitroreductase family protein [Methyloligellaceae bacterium]